MTEFVLLVSRISIGVGLGKVCNSTSAGISVCVCAPVVVEGGCPGVDMLWREVEAMRQWDWCVCVH